MRAAGGYVDGDTKDALAKAGIDIYQVLQENVRDKPAEMPKSEGDAVIDLTASPVFTG